MKDDEEPGWTDFFHGVGFVVFYIALFIVAGVLIEAGFYWGVGLVAAIAGDVFRGVASLF